MHQQASRTTNATCHDASAVDLVVALSSSREPSQHQPYKLIHEFYHLFCSFDGDHIGIQKLRRPHN